MTVPLSWVARADDFYIAYSGSIKIGIVTIVSGKPRFTFMSFGLRSFTPKKRGDKLVETIEDAKQAIQTIWDNWCNLAGLKKAD